MQVVSCQGLKKIARGELCTTGPLGVVHNARQSIRNAAAEDEGVLRVEVANAAGEGDGAAEDVASFEAITSAAIELAFDAEDGPVIEVGDFVVEAAVALDRPGVAAEFRGAVDPVLVAFPDVEAQGKLRLGKEKLEAGPVGGGPDHAAGRQDVDVVA